MIEKMKDSKDVTGVNPNTWGAFDKGVDRISKVAKVFLPVVGVGMAAAACTPVDNKTPTVEATSIPGSTASAESPYVTYTPESPKVAPTPYHVEAAGGAYTSVQEAINNSQSVKDQETRIQKWLDYWVNFVNRPFALNTNQIHWKFVYDNFENPSEAMVLIEAGGEYGGKLFTVPVAKGGFENVPPAIGVGQSEIGIGFGPLELTSGAQGQWLSVEKGIPVRRNGSSQIVERLDMETGQWVKVEVDKYAIDMAKLYNEASSYEYMEANLDKFLRAPDLLSDGPAFNDWYYNQYVPALLEGHTREVTYVGGGGTLIRDETNVNMGSLGGVGANRKYAAMDGISGPLTSELPIAYFIHEGVMLPILSFTVNAPNGNNGTRSVILHPKDEFPGDGFGAIKNLYEGKTVVQITFETVAEAGTSDTEIARMFFDDGFNWKGDLNYPYFNYGMGKVKTK